MTKQKATLELIDTAASILREQNPMTVRQLYYQLVSRQVIKNNKSQYSRVSKAIVSARQESTIPWEWIEDRTRRPRTVGMWDDLSDFSATAVQAYRRDVWNTQPAYIEVWLEKDALSGLFENVLGEYGVTLNVGRGYDGWSSIKNAAQRYQARDCAVTILYFGDFDPSGEDMARSLIERLGFFEVRPEVIKCALTGDDVTRYDLPTDFAKKTDTRRKGFVDKHGDVSVELDALPVAVLLARLRAEVENRLDLVSLRQVRKTEQADRVKLARLLGA